MTDDRLVVIPTFDSFYSTVTAVSFDSPAEGPDRCHNCGEENVSILFLRLRLLLF